MSAAKKRIEEGTSHFHCCVPLCNNDSRRETSMSFHRIPAEKELRKKWIHKIRRDPGKDFKITHNTRVCAEHFEPIQIRTTASGRRYLQFGSIPSRFSWNINHPKRRITQRAPLPQSQDPTTPPSTSMQFDSQEIHYTEFDPLADHTYATENLTLEQKLDKAQKKIGTLCRELDRLSITSFGTERFKASDEMIRYYTGISSYGVLLKFFDVISSDASTVPLWSTVQQAVKGGQLTDFSTHGFPRTLPIKDELFLFLCRMRQGFDVKDLGVRFNIATSSVSRITITWANFLYCVLGSLPIWPCREQIDKFMPNVFKFKDYAKTRVIIDCCEIQVQAPSSLFLQSELFSHYKNHVTVKCLVGIAPHGPITFVSSLYPGSISDKEIFKRSGLLELLECHDHVMADKGFLIKDILAKKGVTLNRPPFNSNGRFTEGEVALTQEIASLRIHVERAIRRVKEYEIFSRPLPLTLFGTANQMWTVACLMSNFGGPLF